MAFCDWLQYTVKQSYVDYQTCLLDVLGSLPWPFQDLIGFYNDEALPKNFTFCSGINYYGRGIVFDCGLKVFFDPLNENMGTNIVLSGDVFEMVEMDSEDFQEWLEKVVPSYDIHITRIDFAIDTEVDFSYFLDKVNKREYRTKYRTIQRYLNLNDRGTLYFGKRGKGTFCRIYDKYLEGIEKLKSESKRRDFQVEHGDKSWTRIEFEFRGVQALDALKCFIYSDIHSVFLGHLDFTDRFIEGHMERCKTDEVYMEIINCDFKRRLSNTKNSDYSVDWVMKVALPSVLALREVDIELFDELLKKSSASPSAIEKAKHSILDIYRLKRSVNSVDRIESDKPVYIDKFLVLEECVK